MGGKGDGSRTGAVGSNVVGDEWFILKRRAAKCNCQMGHFYYEQVMPCNPDATSSSHKTTLRSTSTPSCFPPRYSNLSPISSHSIHDSVTSRLTINPINHKVLQKLLRKHNLWWRDKRRRLVLKHAVLLPMMDSVADEQPRVVC